VVSQCKLVSGSRVQCHSTCIMALDKLCIPVLYFLHRIYQVEGHVYGVFQKKMAQNFLHRNFVSSLCVERQVAADPGHHCPAMCCYRGVAWASGVQQAVTAGRVNVVSECRVHCCTSICPYSSPHRLHAAKHRRSSRSIIPRLHDKRKSCAFRTSFLV